MQCRIAIIVFAKNYFQLVAKELLKNNAEMMKVPNLTNHTVTTSQHMK